MATADYRCGAKDCVNVQELPLDPQEPCVCEDCGQSRIWVRVWRPVGIGRVPGAGGSPSR